MKVFVFFNALSELRYCPSFRIVGHAIKIHDIPLNKKYLYLKKYLDLEYTLKIIIFMLGVY